MTAWHENARFNVFTECDVYIEDDHYLYVENQAFDYNGNYSVCGCKIVDELNGSRNYVWEPWCGADNEYIIGLEKAPWSIAREVIERQLSYWKEIEEEFDDNNDNIYMIEDARRCLMEYATEGEVFTYC